MEFKTQSGRTITIHEFISRKIDRDYQMALSEGVTLDSNGRGVFPAINVQKANDILVMGMTGLSAEELDSPEISKEDFNQILNIIQTQDQKKSQPKSSSGK